MTRSGVFELIDESNGQNSADAYRKKQEDKGTEPHLDAPHLGTPHIGDDDGDDEPYTATLEPEAPTAESEWATRKLEAFRQKSQTSQESKSAEESDDNLIPDAAQLKSTSRSAFEAPLTDPALTVTNLTSKEQSQAETSEDFPKPAKITVVRSQKSLTDLPAMAPPEPSNQSSHPPQRSNETPKPLGPSIVSNSSDSLRAYREQSISDQEVTALTETLDPKTLFPQSKARSASNEPVVLVNQPSVSQQNLRPMDMNAGRRSETKFVLPGPDQPMPPPQAPPQFLGDQGHTRPSDASRDRSQFGTASKHGGAPIALLTNVNRKKKAPLQVPPAIDFIKNNLISCALLLALLLLVSLLFINRDPKGENVTNMDLTILNSAQRLEDVNHLVSGKKYEEALQLCDVVIQKDTKYAEAYHARGQVYMAMHRYREAVDDFTTAESFNHRSIDIHIDRAAALYHVQDFDKAKREYDEILLTEPNNAAAHFGRGLAEENLGNTKEALDDFQRTLELQKDYAAASEEMGTIHFAKGDLKKSYDDYTTAIKIAPAVPRFYFNRANALKQDHQTQRAIADYCKAIQLDPARPEFFNNRGLLYLENNEPAKALTDFSSAVDLDPSYTIAKHNLTLAQERVRR